MRCGRTPRGSARSVARMAASSSIVCRSLTQPSWRAARRSAASDTPPTYTGTGSLGAGSISSGGTSKNSPWCSTTSPVQSLRSTSSISSARLPRRANGVPMASNSSSIHPMPMPRPTRLPESTAAVPTCLATWTGVRAGRMYTVVRKRSRCGDGRQVPDRHPRVGPRRAHLPPARAVLRVRVGRPRLDGVDEVVGHRERAPAVLVAGPGQRHELVGLRRRCRRSRTRLHQRVGAAVDAEVGAVDVLRVVGARGRRWPPPPRSGRPCRPAT